MAGVVTKFFVASMFMWMAPVAILHAFNNGLLPGLADTSPHSLTLLSGFLAVMSVNVVIAFYICMALKEPSDKHEPDLKFLAKAKDSLNKTEWAGKAVEPSQSLKKQEYSIIPIIEHG